MKTHNLLLHICLLIFVVGVFTSIKAQTPMGKEVNQDDPVVQAIERIEKIVDKHLSEGENLNSLPSSNDTNEIKQIENIVTETKENKLERVSKLKLSKTVLSNFQTYQETLTRILQQEGMPSGLLSVALVESGFHPFATSPKGAKGIWQFMPDTARRYGLRVESNIDYRTNPEFSTKAAAQYLKDLYRQFGDWKLALAAYNAGENRIQRIINKTKLYSFDELATGGYLPRETANYVPAIMSLWPNFGKPLLLSQPENNVKPLKENKIRVIIQATFKLGLPTFASSNSQ
ncbi:MAG: lytic transglycosylase domain-containing protein [Acidobacteria bacterium]|nr:lytic transglycosylase domain-containing protein [Acidobacteriota bacterium]MBN8726071.1 lytic transglycosylase domain-containing protein [Acidobacteriota bacterium]